MLITNRETSENESDIVFGIVAPIGTDLDRLTGCLRKELATFGYSVETIRLSSLLLPPNENDLRDEEMSRSELLMNRGDAIRKHMSSGDAAAGLALAKIRVDRSRESKPKIAWILRTLKNPEEVRLLRHVYGSRFVSIGVNEDEASRRTTLEGQIRRTDPHLESFPAHSAKLIARDENSGQKMGQNVRSTNRHADFYVNIGSQLIHDVKRMVRLLFGQPFETPTRDEHAMFHAFATSLRSSDPGRQVGAVLTSPDGDIIAVGTNEVPKPGGGQYWPGDDSDGREFQLGRDNNKWTNYHLLQEIIDVLAHNRFLREDLCEGSSEDRYRKIRDGAGSGLDEARVNSLIEFGRITHAEMSVLTDCARLGKPTHGSTIYVTAFPCHMCMRLIIASGVKRIVYVDPYPKSLAVDMYGGALSFDSRATHGRVQVESFSGTSWRIYQRVFEMVNRDRSPDGIFEWHDTSALQFRGNPGDDNAQFEKREDSVIGILRDRLDADIPQSSTWQSMHTDLLWVGR